MDQGLITNPKDLERMQHELESLERRISTLEDEELEVMETLEDAQRELDALDRAGRRGRRAARRRSPRPATRSWPRSTRDLASVAGRPRRRRPTGLPADLLALYDKLRAPKGGVGAAALRARTLQRLPAQHRQRRARGDQRGARRRGGPLRGVPADPGPHPRVRPVTGPRSVVIEADGGSRGNPGPAAYGAVLKDADTGEVIAEDGSTIGVATNNVAEYSGLIAGLELAAEFAPDADIEVRMDSKLVVEQMSGAGRSSTPT